MPRERASEVEREREREERGNERKRKEHLSLLWKSIEESSESASPGQRLCHLIGYVEQFILFFPIPLAREGERREEVREEERRGEHERERRRLPKERQSAPFSTYLLPSAHVDAIFQYRVKRALPFSFTHPPSPFSRLPLVSSRFFVLFSRRKRKWKRGTKREKGKKGAWWAAQEGGEGESEELRLASAVTREPSKVG